MSTDTDNKRTEDDKKRERELKQYLLTQLTSPIEAVINNTTMDSGDLRKVIDMIVDRAEHNKELETKVARDEMSMEEFHRERLAYNTKVHDELMGTNKKNDDKDAAKDDDKKSTAKTDDKKTAKKDA